MAQEHHGSSQLKLLSDMELFADFTTDELNRVVDLSEQRDFKARDVIVDQGDPGVECFVIESGRASVYVRGEYVTTSGSGSMIGEMALIDHRPRTATVIADTDLRVLRFDSEAFRKLLDEMPKVSERVYTVLRDRLERLSEL